MAEGIVQLRVIVVAIAIGNFPRYGAEGSEMLAAGCTIQLAAAGAEAAAAHFQRAATLVRAARNDIDGAGTGTEAIKHGAGCRQYLDAFDGVERNGRKVHARQVGWRNALAVEQDQGVLAAGNAEAEHVDGG